MSEDGARSKYLSRGIWDAFEEAHQAYIKKNRTTGSPSRVPRASSSSSSVYSQASNLERAGEEGGLVSAASSQRGPELRVPPSASTEQSLLPLPPTTVSIGSTPVNAIGLGTLPLGVTYSGGGRPTRPEAIAVIHEALDCGINFFDTSDTYCQGPGGEVDKECALILFLLFQWIY